MGDPFAEVAEEGLEGLALRGHDELRGVDDAQVLVHVVRSHVRDDRTVGDQPLVRVVASKGLQPGLKAAPRVLSFQAVVTPVYRWWTARAVAARFEQTTSMVCARAHVCVGWCGLVVSLVPCRRVLVQSDFSACVSTIWRATRTWCRVGCRVPKRSHRRRTVRMHDVDPPHPLQALVDLRAAETDAREAASACVGSTPPFSSLPRPRRTFARTTLPTRCSTPPWHAAFYATLPMTHPTFRAAVELVRDNESLLKFVLRCAVVARQHRAALDCTEPMEEDDDDAHDMIEESFYR